MPNLPNPSFTTTYILAIVTTVLGLFATQGWITNGTTKLVTGLAATFVPLAIAVVVHLTGARIHAAKINASAPVPPVTPPAA